MPTETLTLLTTDQASKLVRLSGRTLEGLRVRGGGPVYRKLAGRVFYALSDVMAWVDAQARESTSDPGKDAEPDVPVQARASTSDPGKDPEPEVPVP